MAVLFGGKGEESLTSLHHITLSKTILSSKSFVAQERLTQTKFSTRFHSLRVYSQLMVWTWKECHMDMLKLGWKLENSKLTLVM